MTLDEMKKRKKELGYSNREISERSGVAFGTVQKIFGGKTTSPRSQTIRALEKVLRPEQLSEQFSENHESYYQTCRPMRRNTDHFVAEEAAVYDAGVYDSGVRKKQGEYTVEDWEKLPDNVRAELIQGTLYFMAAPMIVHQELVSILTREFGMFVRENHGNCRVFPAPCGVRLFPDDKTMVEPDITVICNRDQITRKWLDGAPDLVVEVLSSSTRMRDLVKKLNLYESSGVQEYWIVDPAKRRVMVYRFHDFSVVLIYTFQDKVPVGIWDEKCVIDFSEISQEIAYLYDDHDNLK